MEQSNKNDNFIVGFVRASHGISGEFKVESTSGEYEQFASMKEVALRNGKTGEQKPFPVEYAEVGGRDLYLKLAGIDSPKQCKSTANGKLSYRENTLVLCIRTSGMSKT